MSICVCTVRSPRGAATATSDVDLIAEFDTTKHLPLLDMVGLENRLSDLLGAPVDLSPEDTLKEPVAERAARECRSCLLGSRPFSLRDVAEAISRNCAGPARRALALGRWPDRAGDSIWLWFPPIGARILP